MNDRAGKKKTMRQPGTRIGACLVLAASLPLALSCRTSPAEAAAGTTDTAEPTIALLDEAVARQKPIEDVFLLTGELRSVHSLDLVTPRSDSWQVQIKWLADDGTEVHQGDRTIEFDNSQIMHTIEEKKLRLIQTEIDLESREAAIESERDDKKFALERAENAHERARVDAAVPEDLLPGRKWQEYQSTLRTSQATLAKARMDLEAFEVSAKADLEVLRIARDKATRDIDVAQKSLAGLAIKAPADGIFVVSDYWREERKFQIGDTTWPGQTIATIPDLAEMEVIGYLPEVDDRKITRGMRARCILDTYPDRVFEGKIEDVAAVAEAGGQRTRGGFRVRASLVKSDPALMRPGMSVRAEVIRQSWDRALTVPKQAVRREAGKTYILRPGGGERTEVAVAACTATDCIVSSGLSEGDRVALR